jgi:hypothetical protein
MAASNDDHQPNVLASVFRGTADGEKLDHLGLITWAY